MMREIIFEQNNASAELYHDFFETIDPDRLLKGVSWRQNTIRVFGKSHLEPRLTAWFGPKYTYSGIAWPATPMSDEIVEMNSRLCSNFEFGFNAVLINQYRDGNDAMGWHRDNEAEIDHSLIASVSFGASRSFQIRSRQKENPFKVSVELPHASLLLMRNMQNDFEHAVPRRKKVTETRINLTFRRIIA